MSALAKISEPVADQEDAEISFEAERRIVRLNNRYAQCLDAKRLDAWVGFFAEDGIYRIYPREILEAGLPACLLYLDGRKMMRDRVLCLREIILYADNAARHFVGAPAIREEEGKVYAVTTNVIVVHSDVEGHSQIFCAGEYRDRIVERNGRLLFLEKTVVVDTFTVPSHLSHPV